MRAICGSCHAKLTVKTLRGRAPCCGYYNSLQRIPANGDKEAEKRKKRNGIARTTKH